MHLTYLEVFHEDCHDNVDKHKLCHEHENNEEHGRHQRTDAAVADAFFGLVAVVSQGILKSSDGNITIARPHWIMYGIAHKF